MTTYLACMGTRPEIIKMFPVYRTLKERGQTVHVLHTGQHEQVADALYQFFDMGPDYSVRLSRSTPTLSNLTAELLRGIDDAIREDKPDVVLVQGDTASALVGAMVGYFHDIPVAHVEAGLRTGQREPFPEEKNRELISRLATWHFTPTDLAYDNLKREGLDQSHIYQVGNTVIDAALWVSRQLSAMPSVNTLPEDVHQFLNAYTQHRLVLVTAHRRENWGRPIQLIAAAVAALLKRHPDVIVVWPQHPNPAVRQDIQTALANVDADTRSRIGLTDPLEYPALIEVLSRSNFTLTDSGGIQEEASALSKPVLIARESTERQELVTAGGARLVGTNPDHILEQGSLLLRCPQTYASMQLPECPFGDGRSAERIADVLTYSL
jgi:UDP-N-acetylglucosamine 2-epimerase (non-hydrolysing)